MSLFQVVCCAHDDPPTLWEQKERSEENSINLKDQTTICYVTVAFSRRELKMQGPFSSTNKNFPARPGSLLLLMLHCAFF